MRYASTYEVWGQAIIGSQQNKIQINYQPRRHQQKTKILWNRSRTTYHQKNPKSFCRQQNRQVFPWKLLSLEAKWHLHRLCGKL